MNDTEFLLQLLSAIGGIGGLATIVGLGYWLGKKFAQIDSRFAVINQRLEFLEQRSSYFDNKFKELQEYIDKKFEESKNYTDTRLGELENRLNSKIERHATAYTNYQEFFVEFLVSQKVIRPEYKRLLVSHAAKTMRLAVSNPLTKEEWEKLKTYFDKSLKDELTPEEAEEFLELARKVVKEYGEHDEAWKLHIYATITYALIVQRQAEQEEQEKQQ